ncbi:MAG: hypothetical protein ABF391_00750, partial [Akkermansiaceae bacterium]
SPMPLARRLPVEVLFQENGVAYITAEGLKAGDLVVVEGNERLFPFQPLNVQTREENPAKGTQK